MHQVSLFVPVMADAMHIGAKDNAGRIATAAKSSLLVGVSVPTAASLSHNPMHHLYGTAYS